MKSAFAGATAAGVVAAASALIPMGNDTYEEVSVSVWREWAQAVADEYVVPAAKEGLEFLWEYYLAVAGVLLLAWMIKWNYTPLIFEGGWVGLGRPVTKKRIAQDMLPPFPNGWYKILDAKDLKPGKVKSVQLCGLQLVAFRTTEGKVGVLDAYCPHLGANLAVHGKVVDNCVECPFHAWKFNTDGECEGIQYSDSIPKGSSIRSYPAYEAMFKIYVWYDVECREPHWFPWHDEEVESGKWNYVAWSGHEVLTHISEIPENGADSAHLNVVHKDFVFQVKDIPEKHTTISHSWNATWEVDKDEPWKTNMTVRLNHFFGEMDLFKHVDIASYNVRGHQVGPGMVYLYIQTALGTVLMAQNVTPVGQFRQRVEHYYYSAPSVPRWFGKAVAWGASRQFHRDISLWESKTWLSRPLLAKGDGPIQRYRAWFKSHYSENSIPFGSPDDCGSTW